MFVRLRTPGGAGVQRSGSLFTHFWVKSHDRATTVMGCMSYTEPFLIARGHDFKHIKSVEVNISFF
jgi:hypothetical protein